MTQLTRTLICLAACLCPVCFLSAQMPLPYERASIQTLEFQPQIIPDELPPILTGPPFWETVVVREIQRRNPQMFDPPPGIDANRARLFSAPRGICIADGGSVLITDSSTGWIWKIAPDRTARVLANLMISVPYAPPLPPGGPVQPPEVVVVEDPNAPPPPQILEPFSFFIPVGIDVDGQGNIYVADSGVGVVRKIGGSNIVTTIPNLGLRWGNECCYDCFYYLEANDQGNVYVTGDFGVSKVDSTGTFTPIYEALPWCGNKGITVDPIGNVYVSPTEAIYRLSFDEVCMPLAIPDGPIVGCWYLPPGFPILYASNPVEEPQRSANHSRDLALDRLGNLYVADDTRILKFRTNRSVSILAGSEVRGWADGPAQTARLNLATGICVDDIGNIYFTDTGNGVIRKVSHFDWDEDGIPDAEEITNPFTRRRRRPDSRYRRRRVKQCGGILREYRSVAAGHRSRRCSGRARSMPEHARWRARQR